MVNNNQSYLNRKILFTKFLIFFCLITLIKSSLYWVFYDIKSNYASVKFDYAPKTQAFGLEFSDWSKVPFYVKVTLTPEKNF